MSGMKKLGIVLLIAMASPVWGQVQERFKKTEKDTNTQEQTENRENPSTNKTTPSTPQQQPEDDFWDRVMIGGGVSATFGTYTSLYLSPSLGYRLTDKWVVGGGYTYMYFRWNQVYNPSTGNYQKLPNNESYSSTTHGPNVFINFFPFNGFYTGVQYEILNHDVPYYVGQNQYEEVNQWTSVLWLQAGISQKIGNNGYVQLGLKYNVLHDYDSPYGTAWFPVIGFMF